MRLINARNERLGAGWAQGPLVVSSRGRHTHDHHAHARPHLKRAGLADTLRVCGQRVVPYQGRRAAGGTGSVVGIQSGLWEGWGEHGGCNR